MNRQLTEAGIAGFQHYLDTLAGAPYTNPPLHLLSDPVASSPCELGIQFENHVFESRQDCGIYVANLLSGRDLRHVQDDPGFWTALALLWFTQLCPADGRGRRKPAMHYNYILGNNYRHRPRHAIRTAWQLASEHGENARFLQSKPMNVRGELVEQFMARQYYLCCEGAVAAASMLYMDTNTGAFKRGSSGRGKGSILRYIRWLLQIRLTYDLHSISGDDLYNMLPEEFDRFKPVYTCDSATLG